MAEEDQNSDTEAFTFTEKMDDQNSNSESLVQEDEEVSNRQNNPTLSSKVYKPKSFPDLRREFLLKSFIFLFMFNLIIEIPLSVLVIYKKNFFNVIAILVFIVLLIAFSIAAEIGALDLVKNDIKYNIITIFFGLSLMGLSFFFPYPIYLLFFFGILLANNILFILISLIPYKYDTRILMYISNALIIILALVLPILPLYQNMKDSEFCVALFSFIFSALFVIGHTTSAYDKAEEIVDENYKYYKTQIYAMKGTAISSAYITYYTLKYTFIVLKFVLKYALLCFCLMLLGACSGAGSRREARYVDSYGNKYDKYKERID